MKTQLSTNEKIPINKKEYEVKYFEAVPVDL
jgi:hypothetical protein